MVYQRKTKDIWCIETNYGYGWETESEYDKDDYENPCKAAKADLKEYRLLVANYGGDCRLTKRREKIV